MDAGSGPTSTAIYEESGAVMRGRRLDQWLDATDTLDGFREARGFHLHVLLSGLGLWESKVLVPSIGSLSLIRVPDSALAAPTPDTTRVLIPIQHWLVARPTSAWVEFRRLSHRGHIHLDAIGILGFHLRDLLLFGDL